MEDSNFMAIRFKSVAPIEMLIERGSINEALEIIFNTCSNLVRNNDLKFKYNYIPQLDSLTQKIGKLVFKSQQNPISIKNDQLNVFIVSELYQTGGHSRILEDVIAVTDRNSLIVITDIFNNYASGKLELGSILKKLKKVPIVTLPKATLLEKLQNLTSLLTGLNPNTIGIIAHHQDVVAYAACNSLINCKQVYIHHADHNPTLGATVENYIHLDLTAGDICKRAGFTKPINLAMTAPINFRSKSRGATLSTATSGTFNKFSTSGDLSYAEIVKTILESIDGQHYHIGPIPESYLATIIQNLIENKINPKRFNYLGPVNSLSKTLIDLGVDIYVTSAPVGGGKAYVEALSCGLAILRFSSCNEPLIEKHFYNDDTITWSNTIDLKYSLSNLSIEVEQEKSRKNFLLNHNPEAFKKTVNDYF